MPRAELAARTVWEAWEAHRQMDALPEAARPRDDAEGHAAQAALERFAGPRRGWKLAATSAAAQRHLGISAPLAGRLFGRFFHADGATLAAVSRMGVVEAELAFRLGSDLDGEGPISSEEALAAVEAVCLAIEVPDTRLSDFATAGSPQLIADDAFAGRVVVGPEIRRWSSLDLRAQRTKISVDGEPIAQGLGANVLDGPASALHWLAEDLLRRGEHLAAGDLVMTGTTTAPVAIEPGSRVVAEFEDLGEVRLQFEA